MSAGPRPSGVEPLKPPGAGLLTRQDLAWETLAQVPDPEVPAVSLVELGIVRSVQADAEGTRVVLTPTYSGCPATEVIEAQVRQALEGAGLGPVQITLQRAPAWTTDWISDSGRDKLRAYGIAPPGPVVPEGAVAMRPSGTLAERLRRGPPAAAAVACPRCGSAQTEKLAAFGSTACKALYRCIACREPFEHFKPI